MLGWVGLLGLVWLSSMIFNSMEMALNIIFRSQKKRNYFVSKLLAISMIPMGWIVGATSVAISYVAVLLVKQPIEITGGIDISLTAMSGAFLRYVVPYAISVIFFYFRLPDNPHGENSFFRSLWLAALSLPCLWKSPSSSSPGT